MSLKVVPLHRYPDYMQKCCELINDEWKRSESARMRSLEHSCDHLPTCLVLLKDGDLIGHLKLSIIPSIRYACFVESVVIDRKLRGKGYGTYLMKEAEKYCKNVLNLNCIYLSTKGQEQFYNKLGYNECQPISIYGSFTSTNLMNNIGQKVPETINNNITKQKILINTVNNSHNRLKTYMNKYL